MTFEAIQLTKSAMVGFVMNDILYYGGLVLGAWVIGWYLIYFVSGFHLKTIGINNGILFNGISYTNKRVSLTLRTFRIRLWGNTRKIVMDDLVIKLHSAEKSTKRAKNPRKGTIWAMGPSICRYFRRIVPPGLSCGSSLHIYQALTLD